MSKQYKRSLFIFHRDLRLADNNGLYQALTMSEQVIPCFIFDPRQIGKNKYKSSNALEFMYNSLKELNEELVHKGSRLYCFVGKTDEVVAQLLAAEDINAVFSNYDYTPFSRKRDDAIKRVCAKAGIEFVQTHDALLVAPGSFAKKDGTPYTVFTPFWRAAHVLDVALPRKNAFKNYYAATIRESLSAAEIKKLLTIAPNPQIAVHGGRREALGILRHISQFKRYEQMRDLPAQQTSRLSAHLKFGTVSIRETWHAIAAVLGEHHPLLRQLYWRDFFTHIAYHFPHVFGGAFHHKYDKLKWTGSARDFARWCKGETGFPIVDAGMRELNTTGFMHNRVRMIVASFLVKDLHIDWREGERYFAQKLVDYDPCVNNGNWQWVASTGCDATPYFRIFNPWLQQKKFDAKCEYIYRWIPELQDVPVADIHNWYRTYHNYSGNYHAPIVDHKEEREKVLSRYKQNK